MSLFSIFFSEEDKIIDKLLKDHPNSNMRITGSGTTWPDPEKVRESEEYKAFTQQMEKFLESR